MKMMTNYRNLLKHPKWFEKRKQILLRDGNSCVMCGSKEKLHIHHRQYHYSKETGQPIMPWDYNPKYLITLCENCHTKGHSKIKIPHFKIKKIKS